MQPEPTKGGNGNEDERTGANAKRSARNGRCKRLCAATVDRLTFGGNIIETGTESYRLAHTKAADATAT